MYILGIHLSHLHYTLIFKLLTTVNVFLILPFVSVQDDE